MKKIVLVGAYPPSKEGLNEYNRELAKGISSLGYDITVLANTLTPMESKSPKPEDKGITVKRTWACGSITSGARIIRALYSEKPDLVIFGLLFTTFGFNPVVSFINLLAPVVCRLLGFRTHVVLHHIYERIDMSRYGKGTDLIKRAGLYAATWLLLRANRVFVFIKFYKDLLEKKYRVDNITYIPHGCFAELGQMPPLPAGKKNVLIMGKFGAYKRLDFAFELLIPLCEEDSDVKLVVAGRSHPYFPGHVEQVIDGKKRFPFIEFKGYVKEEKLQELFTGINVVVIPYFFLTGASGIVHQAINYGRPIVAISAPEVDDMKQNEGIHIETVPPDKLTAFREKLKGLLDDTAKQQEIGRHNFLTSQKILMPKVAKEVVGGL